MSEVKEEKDPNGVAPNQPGAKLDHGKLRAGLVIKGFQNALKAVAEVGTFGANKYTDDGWKSVPDGLKRYEDALYRHLLADGMDEQSGLPHLAHAAWNILAMLELQHKMAVKFDGVPTDELILALGESFRRNPITSKEREQFLYQDIDMARLRPMSEAEKACQGSHFTDEELRILNNWQFSDEMWEYAYCNPKNAKLFEMVKEKWASYKNKPGVSVVLLDKDRFNASDLVVDGIHVPSLPKDLINSALVRCYPVGSIALSPSATLLIKAGIGFTAAKENK